MQHLPDEILIEIIGACIDPWTATDGDIRLKKMTLHTNLKLVNKSFYDETWSAIKDKFDGDFLYDDHESTTIANLLKDSSTLPGRLAAYITTVTLRLGLASALPNFPNIIQYLPRIRSISFDDTEGLDEAFPASSEDLMKGSRDAMVTWNVHTELQDLIEFSAALQNCSTRKWTLC